MTTGIELFSLQGKTALITGATGYLGRAMSFALAEAGAHVLVNSRSHHRCTELVEEITSAGYSASCAVFDITSEEAVGTFFTSHQDSQLNIIINNAYLGSSGNIEGAGANSYQQSYEVSVVASHNILRYGLPSLRKAVKQAGEASVINISSMYAMVSPDQNIYESAESVNPPFYGAAKAALQQWTRYAACEFGKEGIRVNAISPGAFPSDDVQNINPTFIRRLENKVPLGRIGMANELKGPVLFLASPASSYINGANIVVDGGWTCW